MALSIKKNDVVQVITGDHKGARGKVLRIDRVKGHVVVEGVNMVYRHVKPTRRNPQGGRVQKEAPIHVSNVLPYDSVSGRGQRVHFECDQDKDGALQEKRRVSKSGQTLHVLSRGAKAG